MSHIDEASIRANLRLHDGVKRRNRRDNIGQKTVLLYRKKGPPNARKFWIECVFEDIERRNLFIAIGNGENEIRRGENAAVKEILKELEDVYFFSEENNV